MSKKGKACVQIVQTEKRDQKGKTCTINEGNKEVSLADCQHRVSVYASYDLSSGLPAVVMTSSGFHFTLLLGGVRHFLSQHYHHENHRHIFLVQRKQGHVIQQAYARDYTEAFVKFHANSPRIKEYAL